MGTARRPCLYSTARNEERDISAATDRHLDRHPCDNRRLAPLALTLARTLTSRPRLGMAAAAEEGGLCSTTRRFRPSGLGWAGLGWAGTGGSRWCSAHPQRPGRSAGAQPRRPPPSFRQTAGDEPPLPGPCPGTPHHELGGLDQRASGRQRLRHACGGRGAASPASPANGGFLRSGQSMELPWADGCLGGRSPLGSHAPPWTTKHLIHQVNHSSPVSQSASHSPPSPSSTGSLALWNFRSRQPRHPLLLAVLHLRGPV